MKKSFLAILAGATLLMVACTPTYDKDNPKESFAEMTKDMTSAERVEFAAAIALIKMKHMKNPDEAEEVLDGKTAEEIMEYSETMGDVSIDIRDLR